MKPRTMNENQCKRIEKALRALDIARGNGTNPKPWVAIDGGEMLQGRGDSPSDRVIARSWKEAQAFLKSI